MNDYDYNPVELLRLQTATQITSALISRGETFTLEEGGELALSITEFLLEKCKTPQDKKVKVPEGQNIYLIDGHFYYEYTNQEGDLIRTKLGE